jgi:hypothetical protein
MYRYQQTTDVTFLSNNGITISSKPLGTISQKAAIIQVARLLNVAD